MKKLVKKEVVFSRARGEAFQGAYARRGGRDLAVILPGLNYGCDRPLLAWVSALFEARELDLVELKFGYAGDAEFGEMVDTEQLAEIERDGSAIVEQCLSLSDFRSLIVVGKSLGSISMMGLGDVVLPEDTRLVWLTPSLRGAGLCARMAEIHYPGFSLIGGCDPSLEISRSAEYRGISGLTHLEVAGMDHGWEHEGGEAASVRGLKQAMAALDDWL